MATVLAIDDSPISRQIYYSTLQAHCEIVLAESAEQAWSLITTRNFDLVITDFNLPGINGLELIKKLKSSTRYTSIPTIVISGDAEFVNDAKNIGTNLWLLKPVKPSSLLKAVKTLLSID